MLSASDVGFSLEFDAKKAKLTNDVNGKIASAVRALKESFSKQLVALQTEELNHQERLYACEKRLMQEGKSFHIFEARCAHEDISYKSEKALMGEEIQAKSENTVKRGAEMAELRKKAAESVRNLI